MNIRIYPRLRYVFAENWGQFVTITLQEMLDYLDHWWSMGKWVIEGDHITSQEVDDWFYERYMQNIDHTILKDGKWRSGV